MGGLKLLGTPDYNQKKGKVINWRNANPVGNLMSWQEEASWMVAGSKPELAKDF